MCDATPHTLPLQPATAPRRRVDRTCNGSIPCCATAAHGRCARAWTCVAGHNIVPRVQQRVSMLHASAHTKNNNTPIVRQGGAELRQQARLHVTSVARPSHRPLRPAGSHTASRAAPQTRFFPPGAPLRDPLPDSSYNTLAAWLPPAAHQPPWCLLAHHQQHLLRALTWPLLWPPASQACKHGCMPRAPPNAAPRALARPQQPRRAARPLHEAVPPARGHAAAKLAWCLAAWRQMVAALGSQSAA